MPTLVRLAVRYPMHTLMISARIRWHGIRLYLKGVPAVARADDDRHPVHDELIAKRV